MASAVGIGVGMLISYVIDNRKAGEPVSARDVLDHFNRENPNHQIHDVESMMTIDNLSRLIDFFAEHYEWRDE